MREQRKDHSGWTRQLDHPSRPVDSDGAEIAILEPLQGCAQGRLVAPGLVSRKPPPNRTACPANSGAFAQPASATATAMRSTRAWSNRARVNAAHSASSGSVRRPRVAATTSEDIVEDRDHSTSSIARRAGRAIAAPEAIGARLATDRSTRSSTSSRPTADISKPGFELQDARVERRKDRPNAVLVQAARHGLRRPRDDRFEAVASPRWRMPTKKSPFAFMMSSRPFRIASECN